MSQSVPTPAELFGPLFSAVQERRILGDGKAFVDAVPRWSVADIMAAFDRFEGDDSALRQFVDTNFILPPNVSQVTATATSLPLREHIRAMWPALARDPTQSEASALAVRHRHVVPGGRFREIYYWDSFFTMLGLIRDGEIELAEGIVNAMTDLIEEHGHVPNGARTYFVGRSQPPLFHMMVALLDNSEPAVAARRLAAMKLEHAWWMRGTASLQRGSKAKRVVMLSDGSILNRYWDPRGTPRDESWGEDVETARTSCRPAMEVYRDLRAGAESGWDFSSRWLDGPSLSSIRTTTLVPVDLNAFLYGLEKAIASSGGEEGAIYGAWAEARRTAMHRHMWNDVLGCFCDYDLVAQAVRAQPTAAALAPLLSGLASQDHAEATARLVAHRLVAPGGLRTSLVVSGEQWDVPNGWAPLQWMAVTGLRRFGQNDLANAIARRWIGTVESVFADTGLIFEKYDIETCSVGSGGEYTAQIGFGWTNGVTADLIDSLSV
ncbi:alpha,alpha-trehalase TreF [Novosphingobium sp. PASSN1]|uniref:alpha,alpha-trehalase TreF n=1 Tax=Novosphingobium sp. PASSN1 TaxID=2015561 RepID=UPI0025D72CEF|nr:alpha,alpha-trehalase TreF [Novosphingobium sp. PASSN1]